LPGDAGDTLAVLAVATATAAAAAVAGAFADDVFVVALPTVAANTDSQRKKTNQSLSLVSVNNPQVTHSLTRIFFLDVVVLQ